MDQSSIDEIESGKKIEVLNTDLHLKNTNALKTKEEYKLPLHNLKSDQKMEHLKHDTARSDATRLLSYN
mgnify:CR=1 FL=1